MGVLTVGTVELAVHDDRYVADAIGTPEVPKRYVIPSALTPLMLKSGKLVLSYVWAATADGTIQFYDYTAGAVIVETSTKTGGESSVREELSIINPDKHIGHELGVRVNVTVAGAAGETVRIRGATLELITGM